MPKAKETERVRARKALFARHTSRVGSYAMLQPTKAIAKVSSAALRTVQDAKDNQKGKVRRDRERQAKAYEFIELVSELGFIVNLKANLVARCDLVLQETKRLADGGVDWVPTTNEKARRVDEAFVGPQGGQAELKRRGALHLSTGGEFHLLATAAGDDGSLVWEVLSVIELLIDASGVYRKRDGNVREDVDADNYTARCWRASAAYSDLAESEVLRVLPLCAQIVRVDQALEAIVNSKLSAQAIFVPTELTFADIEDGPADGEGNDDDDIDPFNDELIKHMEDPIRDRASTAALVPLVIRGPAEFHDRIHMIELGRSLDSMYQDLRKEALARLFQGVDAPPEMVSGKAGLSGLGGGNVAISIDQDLINKHVLPAGELLADFFTVAYLRPMLETFEGLNPEESQGFRYAFDPAKIMSNGDEPQAADRLHKAEKLSDEAYVRANGFDVADMPDDDELTARRTWSLIQSAPAVFAPALLTRVPGFTDVDVTKLGPGGPGDGGSPTGGGPDGVGLFSPEAPTGRSLANSVELLGRSLVVAADAALEAALERAGSRIVSSASRHPDTTLRDRMRSVSKARALTIVGDADLKALGLDVGRLLDGAWDSLAIRSRAWIRQHLIDEGHQGFEADDRAALAANLLCTAVNEYVVEHAHSGFKVGPNGLRLPDAVVLAALDQLVLVS